MTPQERSGPERSDMQPEIDALLGAYALDAVEPVELDAIERYLATNPIARAEVDDLRECSPNSRPD